MKPLEEASLDFITSSRPNPEFDETVEETLVFAFAEPVETKMVRHMVQRGLRGRTRGLSWLVVSGLGARAMQLQRQGCVRRRLV